MCSDVGRAGPSMGLASPKASAARLTATAKPKHDVGAHPFLELRHGLDIGAGKKRCGHLPKLAPASIKLP